MRMVVWKFYLTPFSGILRDVSFHKITDKDWDLIHLVHVKGAYAVTKAAWPYFREQNYGRVIMTTSAAGTQIIYNYCFNC